MRLNLYLMRSEMGGQFSCFLLEAGRMLSDDDDLYSTNPDIREVVGPGNLCGDRVRD